METGKTQINTPQTASRKLQAANGKPQTASGKRQSNTNTHSTGLDDALKLLVCEESLLAKPVDILLGDGFGIGCDATLLVVVQKKVCL